jgi:hypothetical protein
MDLVEEIRIITEKPKPSRPGGHTRYRGCPPKRAKRNTIKIERSFSAVDDPSQAHYEEKPGDAHSIEGELDRPGEIF